MLRRGLIQPASRSSRLICRGFGTGKNDPPRKDNKQLDKKPQQPQQPQQQTQPKPVSQSRAAPATPAPPSKLSAGRLDLELSGAVALVGAQAPLLRKLFKAAKAQNVIDRVASDLAKYTKWFNDAKNHAARLVEFGVMKPDKKKQFIESSFSKLDTHALVADFVNSLNAASLMGLLNDSQKDFFELASVDRKEVACTVMSAEPLSGDKLNQARQAMTSMAVSLYPGRAIKFNNKVEPRILGGLVFRVGSKIQDLSVEREFINFESNVKSLVL